MEICELRKEDEKAWDEYVLKHPDSTFYHQIGWKNVVEKTYSYKPNYLIARNDDKIVGILPLFLIQTKIFGRKLVSIPFSPYCGVCSDDDDVNKALIEEGKRIVNEKDLDFLEIREFVNHNSEFIINESYITYMIDLEKEKEKVWDKIKRDRRRNVETAKKYGVSVDWNGDLNDFYNIHAQTMRDLGTPAHGIQFFKNCLNQFPNDIKILITKYNDLLIGSQMLFFFKDTIIAAWGSSLDKYKSYNPDQFTIWDVLSYGCENDYKHFDFGRSLNDTGGYKYKERWGGYSKQLYYLYYMKGVNQIPDFSQTNPGRKKFANIWRRMPLIMANSIGPKIRKYFL